jgi:flagellar biosynthesis protein FliP
LKAWNLSKLLILNFVLILLPSVVFAGDLNLNAFKITPSTDGAQMYSVNMQLLLLMTSLTLLPAILLMMTSFTRIIIVLSILRQALGMPQTPSNQIIIGLSIFLSVFIMSPVLTNIYQDSVKPYSEEKITQSDAIDKAQSHIKQFMYNQTREDDLALFMELSQSKNQNIKQMMCLFRY